MSRSRASCGAIVIIGAPDEVLNSFRALSERKKNLELHIFPGVQHGYMMRGMPNAFDHQAREFSMGAQ